MVIDLSWWMRAELFSTFREKKKRILIIRETDFQIKKIPKENKKKKKKEDEINELKNNLINNLLGNVGDPSCPILVLFPT